MLNKKIKRDKKVIEDKEDKIEKKSKKNERDQGISDIEFSDNSDDEIKQTNKNNNNKEKKFKNIKELALEIQEMNQKKNIKKKEEKKEEKKATHIILDESDEEDFIGENTIKENTKKTESKNIHQEIPKETKQEDSSNDNKIKYTLSILFPSSIVDNAQSKELRTYLIGQLARTIGIFKISEVIIFHDKLKAGSKDHLNFFIKNIQYLETPQYLRKTLFPKSEDLTNSGLMNPLDASHHLRIDEWCQYREGCVINRPVNGDYSWVNIGLKKDCKINKKLPEKTRVTVKLNEKSFQEKCKFYTGVPVSMREPFEKGGIYWGYVVRVCEKLSEVFEESIYGEKYDFVIGTSDKGESYRKANFQKKKDFKHCLIVFGGIQGIEGMLEDDEHNINSGKDAKGLFDLYLNTCLDQGLRTIRTEEAIMISLSVLRPELDKLKE